ncbi:MAG: hypothetical protein K0S41_2815, partial [Anaerocolumna sp.]|nr:hypothetical protein [Anaerocolumna sp.]
MNPENYMKEFRKPELRLKISVVLEQIVEANYKALLC